MRQIWPNVHFRAGEKSLMEKLECDLVLEVGKVGSVERGTFQAKGPAPEEKHKPLPGQWVDYQPRQCEGGVAQGSHRDELGERLWARPVGGRGMLHCRKHF